MFTCIYCQKYEPTVIPSIAHIFPDAMGGITFSDNTVCKGCNTAVSRAFEESEIRKFAFYRSIWGIRNSRSNIPPVDAVVSVDGKEYRVSLDELGQPKHAIVAPVNREDGKRDYKVFGPSEKVEEKRKEIDSIHPSIQWSQMDVKDRPPHKVHGKFAGDLARSSLRRLATKIAFEFWALKRGTSIVNDQEYDIVRDFILHGKEAELRCGVISEQKFLNGLLNFPVGANAVVIVGNTDNPILGAFVSFYGLYNFWVILSRKYQALDGFDYLLIESPQTKLKQEPRLRKGTGDLRVDWRSLVSSYRNNEADVIRAAINHATGKFNAAAAEFYD
jgi:hypothetical protein